MWSRVAFFPREGFLLARPGLPGVDTESDTVLLQNRIVDAFRRGLFPTFLRLGSCFEPTSFCNISWLFCVLSHVTLHTKKSYEMLRLLLSFSSLLTRAQHSLQTYAQGRTPSGTVPTKPGLDRVAVPPPPPLGAWILRAGAHS